MSDIDEKHIEEMRKRLEGLLGQWHKPKNPDSEVNVSSLSILKKQEQMLVQVEKMLQQQLEQDQKKLDSLREKVDRLQHGGGS